MKITRRQLRRLVETTVFPKNPVDYVSDPKQKEKINALIDSGDKDNQNMGYELASALQDEGGYEGDDYLADLKSSQNKENLDKMHAMIPGLLELSQSDQQLHDKFVNMLLHPEGIDLHLGLKEANLQVENDDDISAWKRAEGIPVPMSYIEDVPKLISYFNNTEPPVLPDYLFTDPIWKGNIHIISLVSTINNIHSGSLLFSSGAWDRISDQLIKLSGVSRMIVHFKILYFIHRFVKHKIQEISMTE